MHIQDEKMERDLDDLTEKMVNSFKGHDTEDENTNNSKTDFGKLIVKKTIKTPLAS